MKLLSHIPAWLRNKYLISSAIFLAFLLFFDDRDLITNFQHRSELIGLEKSKKSYELEIAITRAELDQLKNDAATLEKYAREKYLMKRDNEDLYIIPGQ